MISLVRSLLLELEPELEVGPEPIDPRGALAVDDDDDENENDVEADVDASIVRSVPNNRAASCCWGVANDNVSVFLPLSFRSLSLRRCLLAFDVLLLLLPPVSKNSLQSRPLLPGRPLALVFEGVGNPFAGAFTLVVRDALGVVSMSMPSCSGRLPSALYCLADWSVLMINSSSALSERSSSKSTSCSSLDGRPRLDIADWARGVPGTALDDKLFAKLGFLLAPRGFVGLIISTSSSDEASFKSTRCGRVPPGL